MTAAMDHSHMRRSAVQKVIDLYKTVTMEFPVQLTGHPVGCKIELTAVIRIFGVGEMPGCEEF